jgi:hypothetical protein
LISHQFFISDGIIMAEEEQQKELLRELLFIWFWFWFWGIFSQYFFPAVALFSLSLSLWVFVCV